MTLGNLVNYGGIILGFWLIATLTFLATGHRQRAVLRLDARRGAQEAGAEPARSSWTVRLLHAFGHR